MKIKTLIFLFSFLSFFKIQAQIDFVLSNTVCVGDTLPLVATSGTFNATSYSWSATPSGPWFASTTANHTDLMFPASGIYTISLDGFSGSSVSSASHVIVVYAKPLITISSTHSLLCAGDGATLSATGASLYAWEPQAVVSALSNYQVYTSLFVTTTFSVTGTDNLGCTNTAYFTQQVVPYPNMQINATSTAVCPGLTATLSALGATSYTWTGGTAGSGVFQQTVAVGAGTYTLVGSNGGQCKDTLTLPITQALPLLIQVTADRLIRCIKDTVVEPGVSLGASGASSYTWQPYDPARMTYSIGQTTYVTPTVSTCYTVTGYGSSCTGSAAICVQVSECVGLNNDAINENNIVIFPNPTKDFIHFRGPMIPNLQVRLIDLTGRILLSADYSTRVQEEVDLDLRDFPSGLYLINFTWGNQTKTQRLIKE